MRVLQQASVKTWDVARVEVEVFDRSTGQRVLQPGENPDPSGYYVTPPWFDMVLRNFQYAHKNSSAFPWSSFDDCPYAADHGPSYDSDVHLDAVDPLDDHIGLFNGIRTTIATYSGIADDYDMSLDFQALVGTSTSSDLCVKARMVNAKGEATPFAVWNCDGL